MKFNIVEKIIDDANNFNYANYVHESKIKIISKNGAEINGLSADDFSMKVGDDLLNLLLLIIYL